MTRYYLTRRPPAPGTFPGKPVNLQSFDDRKYVEEIGRPAWGWIEYEEPLTEKQAADYELVEAAKRTISIELNTRELKFLAEFAEKQYEGAEDNVGTRTPIHVVERKEEYFSHRPVAFFLIRDEALRYRDGYQAHNCGDCRIYTYGLGYSNNGDLPVFRELLMKLGKQLLQEGGRP